MSVNSSSSSNASIAAPQFISMHDLDMLTCFHLMIGRTSIILFTLVNNIVLLPLFTIVLYVWVRQWRQQKRRTMSHADALAVQIIVAELIGIFGTTVICSGSVTGVETVMLTGIYLFIAYQFIVFSFHVLTCVDRYLAVVYPITYVGMRKEKGIRIRIAAICCTWLLAFVETGIMILLKQSFSIYSTTITTLNLVVISFCSISVLRVLYQPRPGVEGGSRQVDAFKLRAFYTIFVLLGVLLFRYGFNICFTVLVSLSEIDEYKGCILWMSSFWFSLPSRLVAPLLFLHREGKLCCRNWRPRQ